MGAMPSNESGKYFHHNKSAMKETKASEVLARVSQVNYR